MKNGNWKKSFFALGREKSKVKLVEQSTNGLGNNFLDRTQKKDMGGTVVVRDYGVRW